MRCNEAQLYLGIAHKNDWSHDMRYNKVQLYLDLVVVYSSLADHLT